MIDISPSTSSNFSQPCIIYIDTLFLLSPPLRSLLFVLSILRSCISVSPFKFRSHCSFRHFRKRYQETQFYHSTYHPSKRSQLHGSWGSVLQKQPHPRYAHHQQQSPLPDPHRHRRHPPNPNLDPSSNLRPELNLSRLNAHECCAGASSRHTSNSCARLRRRTCVLRRRCVQRAEH